MNDDVILAINFNHDGAAVVLTDGHISGFVTTERFSRLKKHPGIREEDLDEVLSQAHISVDDVDHVVICNLNMFDSDDIRWLHGSSLKDTWLEFGIAEDRRTAVIRGRRIPCTVNPDHHLLHAACAFFTSPFSSSLVVALDPLGCKAFAGRDGRLYQLDLGIEKWFDANSLYDCVARDLFGSSLFGAGKVMALASYSFARDLGHYPALSRRCPATSLTPFRLLYRYADQCRHDMASAGRILNVTLAGLAQLRLEQQVEALLAALTAVRLREDLEPNICLSGGTALNIGATERAFRSSDFKNIHLHPACGDDGTAVGAALWYWHHVLGHERMAPCAPKELMYSVRRYSKRDIETATREWSGRLWVRRGADYIEATARLLAEGKVVGWFDGASEVGPRALGHRSILADPRDPTMKDRLNRIKGRETFRPVAPVVLAKEASRWFDCEWSPFMLRQARVRRQDIPAVTHVDGTARVQTLTGEDNSELSQLLNRVEALTGVPVLINTSLNIGGEPIVETPSQALATLMNSAIDYMVFSDMVVSKVAPQDLPPELNPVYSCS